MHPGISIPIYFITDIFVLLFAVYCLSTIRPVKREYLVKLLIFSLIYLIVAGIPVAGAFLPDSKLKFWLQGVGNIWLGFFIYFGGILLLLMLVYRILRWTAHIPRRTAFTFLIISAAAGLVLQVYGMIHAQQPRKMYYDVQIDKDAGDIKEMKVVLIADLHMSVNSKHSTIQKMVDLVNEEDADLVVIAGDIFTSSYEGMSDPDRYAEILRGIKSKNGVYAVYGNHDVEETLFGGFPISPISQAFRTKQMEDFFDNAGFITLYDETVMIEDEVQLVGRVDGEKAGDGTADRMSAAELLKDIDPEKPVLVLEHEPVDYANLKENGADLALSGHTHAGQIFPGNLVVPFFNENAYGYKVADGLQTIVTAGVGFYGPPMRVGTDSEVTVVNITFKGGE